MILITLVLVLESALRSPIISPAPSTVTGGIWKFVAEVSGEGAHPHPSLEDDPNPCQDLGQWTS